MAIMLCFALLAGCGKDTTNESEATSDNPPTTAAWNIPAKSRIK